MNYVGHIEAGVGDPNWWQRLDLNTDFAITAPGDLNKYYGKIAATCYN